MRSRLRSSLLPILLLAAFGALGCGCGEETKAQEDAATTAELDPRCFGHWIHSREEDTDEVHVYRREGFEFPRARGRRGFEILKGGRFVDHPIARGDGVDTHPGRWSLAARGRLSVSFPTGIGEVRTIEIVSVEDDVLRIRR